MTARDIQTLIRQSQDKAYAEQAAYEVSFFTVDDTCVQIRNNKILKRIIIPRGITIGAVNFPRNELYFTRKLTPSGGGTIWLYSKSHKINITVLPVTGRVKIYPVTKK